MKMKFLKTSATNRPLIHDTDIYIDRYREIHINITFNSTDERYMRKAFLPTDRKDFPYLGNKGYMVPQIYTHVCNVQ